MSEDANIKYIDKSKLEYIEPTGPGGGRCTLFDKQPVEDDGSESSNFITKAEKSAASTAGQTVSAAYLHDMYHEVDPKEVIINKLGAGTLEKLRLSGAQILVATYIRPEKKRSGLIITHNTREEDKFQGKCGLVLKMGPLAYVETEKLKFGGYKAKLDDWVWYRPMDGYALSVNGVHCRVLDDVEIKGDIDHPDVIL
jgi:co-chaperonin GroES (HSP10)